VGSGCISISVLKHCPKAFGVAVDISGPATEIALQNAEIHDVTNRLVIISSDVFEHVPEQKFDLIVSNPPYVPLADYEELQPEVRDHDPRLAVTDGSTGLTIIERIIADAPTFLKSGGRLLMEIGFGQDEQVENLFDPESWQSVRVIPDLQGIPRTVEAEMS
jgi:release factor glutamine methyltransferase